MGSRDPVFLGTQPTALVCVRCVAYLQREARVRGRESVTDEHSMGLCVPLAVHQMENEKYSEHIGRKVPGPPLCKVGFCTPEVGVGLRSR